jgi:hypothetical protein
MRALRLTLFVLLLMSFVGQLVRHSYVRWIEPRHSVLDKYDTADQAKVKAATSLDELDRLYAKELAKEEAASTEQDEAPPRKRPRLVGRQMPPLFELEEAIKQWEGRERDILELRFFFGAGALCLVIAFLCERRGLSWAAVSLAIAAFVEMLWWTTVSWHSGLWREYDRLLDNKLLLTVVSIVFLLLTRWRGPFRTASSQSGTA